MSAEQKRPSTRFYRALRWTRRVSQILFFSLFMVLIFATAALTGAGFDAGSANHVPWPVEAFLNLDPLVMLMVFFSTMTVPKTLLLSLVVLVSAFFLGRGFCGWVCPLGALNHFLSEFRPSIGKKAKRSRNQYRGKQRIKVYLLIGVLCASLFGSVIGGLIDPISLLTRGVALSVLPVLDYVTALVVDGAAASGWSLTQGFSDGVAQLTYGTLLHRSALVAGSGILITFLFIGVLFSNRLMPRFFCRYVCPLGALLGACGRFGLLSLKQDADRCTNCGKCDLFCSGAAAPHPRPGEAWRRTECDLCMNCVAECNDHALAFEKAGRTHDRVEDGPNLERRATVRAVAAGVAVVPVLRAGQLGSPLGRPDPRCIRPPGAVDEPSFLSRCIRCGQCMKICPNNALHPALDEAGAEGLWTPVLVPKVGYCEPSCTLCSQVCPTAAIRRVTEGAKKGTDGEKLVRLGTAFVDRGRCLPFAMETPCTVCEEFCPLSPKAIVFETRTVRKGDKTTTIQAPLVVPDRCSGCGACEYACPVHDKAAIRVTSAGESRSVSNRLLL